VADRIYAIRIKDRETEQDPHHAWIMYAYHTEGPWWDMCEGHPDNMWELLDTLHHTCPTNNEPC